MQWKWIQRERFDEQLGVLPPAVQTKGGFLMGEPVRHDRNGRALFAPFIEHGGQFYEGLEPMSVDDFQKLDVQAAAYSAGSKAVQAFKRECSQASFHYADDTGREWHLGNTHNRLAQEIFDKASPEDQAEMWAEKGRYMVSISDTRAKAEG